MPAPKKVWIFDGHIDRYPSVLTAGSVHAAETCTDCHSGLEGQDSRAAAHVGAFQGVATAPACVACHAPIVASADSGLHTTLAGYGVILDQRGFDLGDPLSAERFQEQCTQCHIATDVEPPETACGHCHVSVPAPAGGGLLSGHGFEKTPSMDNNCTACHGSRVKDEYYGLNNALLERNKPFLTDGLPWKEAGFTLAPDVHKQAGVTCVGCHSMDEMHGVGAPVDGDRYEVATAPACDAVGCHDGMVGLNLLHTADHLDAMACQVCHAQPYKNCYECHTDVTDEGVPFYSISDGEPGGNHDHLITFRAGKNPRYTMGGTEKPYALLRHVPVDGDVFTYTGANTAPGLIPDMTASPTWKYASPHNIQRVTEIQSSCSNCHGVDYTTFWLTDPILNAEGWVSPAYEADETSANAGVILGGSIPTLPPPRD